MMRVKYIALVLCWVFVAALLPGCGGDSDDFISGNGCAAVISGGDGPWVGDWLLVNFLSRRDNGAWGPDDRSGIGMTATVTQAEWTETDWNGCSVRFSYSVCSDLTYTRHTTEFGPSCDFPNHWEETGRFVFTDSDAYMIDDFDDLPGDTLLAFKWMRQ